MRFLIHTAAACLSSLPALAQAPGATEVTVERQVHCMGTRLRVEVAAATRLAGLKASEAAIQTCRLVERRLSTWVEDSELSLLNRAPLDKAFTVSAELAADLAFALRFSRITERAFQPGIANLVEAWGLRRGGGARPGDDVLRRALAASAPQNFELVGRRATRRAKCRIDEGGFGKGRALDAAIAQLKTLGIRRAFLDLGGQVAWFGAPRRIEIADPARRGVRAYAITLPEGSVATSGNSERGIVVDGVALGHILDPRTGRPAADFGSLTVWAKSATAADCLSTGLYVLGPRAAIAWAKSRPAYEVFALRHTAPEGGKRFLSTGGFAEARPVESDASSTDPSPKVKSRDRRAHYTKHEHR